MEGAFGGKEANLEGKWWRRIMRVLREIVAEKKENPQLNWGRFSEGVCKEKK